MHMHLGLTSLEATALSISCKGESTAWLVDPDWLVVMPPESHLSTNSVPSQAAITLQQQQLDLIHDPGNCAQGVYTIYIDPSYLIRAIKTNTQDHIYCAVLGQSAVHGAFAGFTGFTVGLVNTHYTYLPIPAIIQACLPCWWWTLWGTLKNNVIWSEQPCHAT